jgi:hypothetical protein
MLPSLPVLPPLAAMAKFTVMIDKTTRHKGAMLKSVELATFVLRDHTQAF